MEYFKKILVRAYPLCVNGKLISYDNDFESNKFSMTWHEDKRSNAVTMIFVPYLSKLNKDKLNAWGKVKIEKIEYSDAGWLIIEPLNRAVERNLTFNFYD